MPDSIERILKEIHLYLASCDSFNNSDSQVVVDKSQIFGLLNKLNLAVLGIMDDYEQTKVSREQAIQKVQKEAQTIYDNANKNAEQVYAASLIYTDDALIELRDMVKKTKAALEKEYTQMMNKIDSQVDVINRNKDELHLQLTELSAGNDYLNIIIDEQKRRDKERQKTNHVENGENLDETESRMTQYAKRSRERDNDEDRDSFSEKIGNTEMVINVNTNHPAYKKAMGIEDGDDNDNTDSQDKLPEDRLANVSVKDYDEEEVPNGEYKASDFDLDAEYFDWKESEDEKPKEDVDLKTSFLGRFMKK